MSCLVNELLTKTPFGQRLYENKFQTVKRGGHQQYLLDFKSEHKEKNGVHTNCFSEANKYTFA